MSGPAETEYLTTKELAALLRIKERKVYDLAASGAIPCSRAMGKLLFARGAVDAWLANNASGDSPGVGATTTRPNVFLGSHDPLLDWALRESQCGLATYFNGSFDGLDRFANGAGIAAGLHILDPGTNTWNVEAAKSTVARQPVVLVEWAWRERGFIVRPEADRPIATLTDLRGRRVAARQAEAGSQDLLEHLLATSGVSASEIAFTPPMRSETDAALAVLEGKADAAFGLPGLAAQYRLAFVPVTRERFDLLVDRRAWFDAPMQAFLNFCHTPALRNRATELTGYDIAGCGQVHFNGA